MKILVHDFSGHPFQVQLSRQLAKQDHNVLHLFSASFQTPKGNLVKSKDDPARFHVKGLTSTSFDKYSYVKRLFQELCYGRDLIKHIAEFKPDVIISSNTPLIVQYSIQRYCRKESCKFVFWLQDLFGIGIYDVLKNKLWGLGRIPGLFFKHLEVSLLRKSDQIVVITEDFKDILITGYKVAPGKIHTIPNWAPIDEVNVHPKANTWSIQNNYQYKFCVVYSGTLGLKHNPQLILEAARSFIGEPNVAFIVISEGLGATWLKAEKLRYGLDNLEIMGFLPFDILPLALASADILVGILENSAGIYSVPSKVLTYHCAGKPLVLAVPKINLSSRIVSENSTGIVVEPHRTEDFIAALKLLYSDKTKRIEYGVNARQYAEEFFDINKITTKFLSVISDNPV
jgi:glycosyltransferase involved in cell wall biosynthesis